MPSPESGSTQGPFTPSGTGGGVSTANQGESTGDSPLANSTENGRISVYPCFDGTPAGTLAPTKLYQVLGQILKSNPLDKTTSKTDSAPRYKRCSTQFDLWEQHASRIVDWTRAHRPGQVLAAKVAIERRA